MSSTKTRRSEKRKSLRLVMFGSNILLVICYNGISYMEKLKFILVFIVSVFILITGFLFLQRFFVSPQDTTAVVKEIRALNRWETASFTVEKIIDSGTNGNVFQQFLFGNRILLITHGEVIGGFDLSQFSQKDIVLNGSTIEITLPAPQILFARIDNAKTKVYDRQQGLLIPSNTNIESEALSIAQKSIQEAACNEGVLTSASTNAKTQLISIFSSFHFKNILITIPSGHC